MRLTRKPFFPRPAAAGPALPRILVRYLLGPDLSQQACQNQLRRPQLDLFQPVEFGRRAGEECGLLGRGAASGDALEGVPQHVVAAAPLVDREVALEHRALGAEGGDAGLDIGPPGRRQFLRARRQLTQMMGEAEHPHAESAELDVNVGAGCELADPGTPAGEDLIALAGIGAEADRPADMVEHDLRVGKGPRQVHKLSELGMVHPGVEAEAERSETGEALADLGVHQQTFGITADPQAAWAGCEAVMKRMPWKRPPPAWIIACNTFSTGAPSARSA